MAKRFIYKNNLQKLRDENNIRKVIVNQDYPVTPEEAFKIQAQKDKTEEILVKTDKNFWVYWDDYLIEDINPEYEYYLRATVHIPKKDWGKLEYNLSKVILHRNPISIENFEKYIEEGESRLVYEGNIGSDEDLKWILDKLKISILPVPLKSTNIFNKEPIENIKIEELVIEMKEALEWYMDNTTVMNPSRSYYETFHDLGMNLRMRAEDILNKQK